MKLFICLCLLLLFPAVSWGYIDPGSGSAIMSAIIGFFVAIGLVIKTFWYKIKSFFTGKKAEPESDSEE
ncbi:hypothetical protein [Marinicella rhabdoformis]|uniref:hypothetical protein n=1 Tax=Marinicella rhabdoformis TaxID=2580566 RepID=UPI0012AEB951|nr:hypothetical protein [Marinicella rhabdoformis]